MKVNIEEIQEIIQSSFPNPSGVPLNHIITELGLNKAKKLILNQAISHLIEHKCIRELSPQVYLHQSRYVQGSLLMNPKGFGFVDLEIPDVPNLYIDRDRLNGALHRDRVQVQLEMGSDQRLRGRITQILERGNHTCVGVYRLSGEHKADLYPQDARLPLQIPIADSHFLQTDLKLEDGTLIAALLREEDDRLTAYPLHALDVEQLQGAIEHVIYSQGLILHQLPQAIEEAQRFEDPHDLLRDLTAISTHPDFNQRKDLRHLPFMTIDPNSAQDFDDALYVQPIEKKGWCLWVAIADVAHYVRPTSVIDQEAQNKSATLYLPAQAFPMLPHRLSNDLCSLKPNIDRLAMVVRMNISYQGEIDHIQFYEAIIHSQARFTYDQAATLLGILPHQELPFTLKRMKPYLETIQACAGVLQQRRKKRGFLNLELIEPRLQFNLRGQVDGFKTTPRHQAHEMVEECMLAANECAARFCIENDIPALYRHHPSPPDYGIERFKIQSQLLGAPFEVNPDLLDQGKKKKKKKKKKSKSKPIRAHQLSKYLNAHQDHPQSKLLSGLLLRSMARALYLAKPGLHFGLGTQTYLHFTSPIRRYPDLWVHRQIKNFLNRSESTVDSSTQGKTSTEKGILEETPSTFNPFESIKEEAQEVAAYASRKERLILEAERKVMGAYKAIYMKQYVGQAFQGTICQTSPKGLTVELEEHPIWCWCDREQLFEFEYAEDVFSWINSEQKRVLHLGKEVWVRIVNVSIIEGQILIALIDPPNQDAS